MAGLVAAYEAMVVCGGLHRDSAQAAAVQKLDELAAALASYNAAPATFLSTFWPGAREPAPRGLYLYGGVGRGKTLLMDLFFETVSGISKRRLHFHEFMAEVHERIQRGRATTDGDPIPVVAAEIAAEHPLICLDELMVTDIADAMIVGRLFRALFQRGVVIVVTSNSPPDRLYWNGLNRQLFLPFVEQISEHTEVFELAAARDFRLERVQGRQLYFFPCNDAARKGVDALWERFTGGQLAAGRILTVHGREVQVPSAAHGVARFAFSDLCEAALGASDYLAIARAFHTVFLEGIPRLTAERRNEARRFIHLIDALYDNGVCLIASAEVEPDQLYTHGDGAELFERTASRLMEMRSEAYLKARGLRHAGARDIEQNTVSQSETVFL